jgi:DNA-directed RNA polymerase II subunit RPB1
MKDAKQRHLTPDEIEDIMSEVRYAIVGGDERVKQAIEDAVIKPIISDLTKVTVYPEIIPEIKKEMVIQVVGSFVQAGTMVGVIAGQSIGQPVTQCTLSGFHKAGLVNITSTQGIPRITEIFNASKSQKNTNTFIFLDEEYKAKPLKDIRLWANQNLHHVTIEDFVDRIQIFKVETFQKTKACRESVWYDSFKEIYSDKYENFDWFLRLYLDKSFLWSHRITMEDLADCIEEKFADAFVVWSPECAGILDIYVDTTHVDYDCEREFIREVVKPEIFSCSPSKFTGITDVFVRNNIETKEWVVDTNGSNLIRVLSCEGVDSTRTHSNEMWEILSVLGIEAVREFIIREVQGILNAEGTGVGRSHLTILADSMCWRGSLTSVSRYGLQKEQAGPLSNASFEQCLDHLLNGAIYGETESTDAVSGGIMCGTMIKIGAGVPQILYDIDKINEGSDEEINEENNVESDGEESDEESDGESIEEGNDAAYF